MLPAMQNDSTIEHLASRDSQRSPAGPVRLGVPVTLSDLRRTLGQRLQTSLEIDRLLGFFYEEVPALMALDGLCYRHPESDLRLEYGRPGPHSASYRLSQDAADLGEITLYRAQVFCEQELAQLESLMGVLVFPLRNALLYRAALMASLKDSLTGAGNRVALDQSLAREVELARRHQQPLSVVMLDMDHFKQLNDRHGHAAGDAALRLVAAELRDQLRNVDMVFRYGGEEFVLLLSNTDGACAAIAAERVRAAIERLPFEYDRQPIPLSISLGCATYRHAETPHELLRRADELLYLAKRNGRNRLQTCFDQE